MTTFLSPHAAAPAALPQTLGPDGRPPRRLRDERYYIVAGKVMSGETLRRIVTSAPFICLREYDYHTTGYSRRSRSDLAAENARMREALKELQTEMVAILGRWKVALE